MQNEDLNMVNFIQFLIKAKQNTFAGGGAPASDARSGYRELTYQEDDFSYCDAYLGETHFIGEELIWQNKHAIWGMNYYGRMLTAEIPDGFLGFLTEALTEVPQEMPYRGPEEFQQGDFSYTCYVEGSLEWFRGKENIFYKGQKIYQLYFHGGEVVSSKRE